jgi:molybdenum cofactor guanylyltransferase
VKVAGLVLAGGQSRRMGGADKALQRLGGRTMLGHVIERLRPQVSALAINANGEPARFAGFGLPVVADDLPGFPGPLAGVLAGLDWVAGHHPDLSYIATAATDAPFLPQDLVSRLVAALEEADADLACAASRGRAHPVFGLWPVRLRDNLREALTRDGIRKVDLWTARHKLVTVPFVDQPVDPFFNANRLADLDVAAALLAVVEAS